MNFSQDNLQLQHLAGGDIIGQPPLFSPDGDYLFILKPHVINMYSTLTGELSRSLQCIEDNNNNSSNNSNNNNIQLVCMHLELKSTDVLVTCTNSGQVQRWSWRTGLQLKQRSIQLRLHSKQQVNTFHLLNRYGNADTACAFVTYKKKGWEVFDTSTGQAIPVRSSLQLNQINHVAVDNCNHKYLVVTQDCYVYFISYENWQWLRLANAHQVPITCVRVHPKEKLVATGDQNGRIFLWRNFDGSNRDVKTTLYHWHHTAITSIAFSATGASFYSSGLEAVLVKWNMAQPELRSFVPRMCAIIRHIAVSADNAQLVICTADNAVQFLGNDEKLKLTLQEFTYIYNDKTGLSQFPIGLRYNPRSNTLALNGRIGHLQFYSPYTKQLLYNLDVTLQNTLSWEANKVLYNIRVTKAAFNIDWMATGEEFNDNEHLPELRLKFWQFKEEKQQYALVCCIELPHENGFRAIEFSSQNQVDNLLCATAGVDNRIKIWSLDDAQNIYHKGLQTWYCIAQCDYKNLPIYAMSFSPDGSVLSAGFGNTLCVYKAETLSLLAALTAPPGLDGQIAKVQIQLPKKQQQTKQQQQLLLDKHKRNMQQFMNFLEKNDESFIKELMQTKQTDELQHEKLKPFDNFAPPQLDETQKAQIFERVMRMPELNLFHKLLVFQRLDIECEVTKPVQRKMLAYLRQTIAPAHWRRSIEILDENLHRLHARERFKVKYRLQQMLRHKRVYDEQVKRHLVPLFSLMNLTDCVKKPLSNGNAEDAAAETAATEVEEQYSADTHQMAQIMHVQFAAGDNAHLVLVCTQFRVLIWNLLNLRLSSVMKLSVEHMAFDELNNLVAVITRNNDLYVFQVNVSVPLYCRPNMPPLSGAIWLPRRYPKQSSIEVDWQAQSTLYFLTTNQDVVYLSSNDDVSELQLPLINFSNAVDANAVTYSTFGAFASKTITDKQTGSRQHIGPLVIANTGKSAVKTLIGMSTHTMPALSLLCHDFIKSLVKPAESQIAVVNKKSTAKTTSGKSKKHKKLIMNGDIDINGFVSHSEQSSLENTDDELKLLNNADDNDIDDDDENMANTSRKAMERRKHLLKANERMQQKLEKTQQVLSEQKKLQLIAKQELQLDF